METLRSHCSANAVASSCFFFSLCSTLSITFSLCPFHCASSPLSLKRRKLELLYFSLSHRILYQARLQFLSCFILVTLFQSGLHWWRIIIYLNTISYYGRSPCLPMCICKMPNPTQYPCLKCKKAQYLHVRVNWRDWTLPNNNWIDLCKLGIKIWLLEEITSLFPMLHPSSIPFLFYYTLSCSNLWQTKEKPLCFISQSEDLYFSIYIFWSQSQRCDFVCACVYMCVHACLDYWIIL